MRVLCSTTPMEGVFGPFVPLARALAAAGHEVLVATGPDLLSRVEDAGVRAVAAGPTAMDGAIAAMADPAVAAAPEGESWQFGAAMFGGVIAPAKLPVLREVAAQFRPDLVVHPPVDVAGALLAAEFRLPAVTYGFGQPLEAPLVAGLAARVAPLWEQAGLPADPYAGIYRGIYLDPRPPLLRYDEPPAGTDVLTIRPDPPGDPDAELPGWAASLGRRPVVYVSLGTVPFFNQPEKFRMLLALLAGEDIDVIVTVGNANDPAALADQPSNVHIERWLSLAAVLPRCDAVVCHAGSGTTLAALACGLPLVLTPQGADQHANASACQRAGVAQVLTGETLTSAAVRDAVLAVLRPDANEAATARRIVDEIAAMPSAAEVVKALEHTVQSAPLHSRSRVRT
jgi:UDP:flavonoid glycosyltransferase YjiC (YdhE family)